MVTRCPHCGTSFRITSSLLKMHQGLVRCGHCSEVFNAFDSLSTVHAPSPVKDGLTRQEEAVSNPEEPELQQVIPIQEEAPPDEAPLPAGHSVSAEAERQESPEEVSPSMERSPPALEEIVPEEVSPEPPAEEEIAQDLIVEKDEDPEECWQKAFEAEKVEPPMLPEERVPEPVGIGEKTEEFEEPAPEEEFFVGEKPSRFRWIWAWGSVLLLLFLITQSLYLFRMQISIALPQAKPYLQSFCAMLGCTVPLPGRADMIGIESSSMQADPRRSGVIDLNASIRNSADFPVAYPLLELTLTDSQDAPVARKVFAPSDYLHGARLSDGIAPNSAAYARIVLDTGSLQANGYRLYLFYP